MFNVFTRLSSFVRNLGTIVCDGLSFFTGVWRRRTALAAENLFLRKQTALFREREKKAMRTTRADRFVFSNLARCFEWRSALMIVTPATLIGWHRKAFRLFLALEIETGREATSDCRSQRLNSAFSG
jgi:hypothetical protein